MDLILSRPNLRERQKADTRAALVAAAAAVFAEQGYGQTTIDDLASHAGTSRATFYLHFASKAEAMTAVIDDVRARAAAWAVELPSPALTRDEVEVIVRSWVDFYRVNLSWFRVWYEASGVEPGIDPGVRAAGSGVVAQLLGHPVTEANPRADVVASATFAMLDRLLYGSLVQGWDVAEADLVAEVADAWHDYFLPRLRALLPS